VTSNLDLGEAVTELKTERRIIEETALEVGLAMAKRRATVKIADQKRQDFVTEADFEAERMIMECLGAHFPGVPFLSEEAGGEELTEGLIFVVDPIDGTVNYFRDGILWAVSIALVEDEVPIAGAVCMPGVDLMLSASKDEPATALTLSTRAVEELWVTTEPELIDARVWYDIGPGISDGVAARQFLALRRGSTQPVNHGSASIGGVAPAMGWCDAYYHSGPKPFDMAAAGLIVQQADGVVTEVNGDEWKAFSKSYVASNDIVHDDLLELLNRGEKV